MDEKSTPGHKAKAEGPPGPIAELGKQFDMNMLGAYEHFAAVNQIAGKLQPLLFEWGRQLGREQLIQQLRTGSPN